MYAIPVERNLCYPSFIALTPTYTLVSRSIVLGFSSVHTVLRLGTYAEVRPAIIEGIAVDVITILARPCAQYYAVHRDSYSFFIDALEILHIFSALSISPVTAPLKLVQIFKIFVVNNRDFSLSKRYSLHIYIYEIFLYFGSHFYVDKEKGISYSKG
jgi:hypothetical protein